MLPSRYCSADLLAVLEQALQRIDQVGAGLGVTALPGAVRRQVLDQLLARGRRPAACWACAPGVPTSCRPACTSMSASASMAAASTDIAGSRMRLREIVERQRELGRGEVEVDALLGGDLQGGRGLGRVLRRQRGAGAHGVLVGQPDLQAVADLGAGDLAKLSSYWRLMLPTKLQLLVQDAQRLAGHCGRGEDGVGHRSRSFALRS